MTGRRKLGHLSKQIDIRQLTAAWLWTMSTNSSSAPYRTVLPDPPPAPHQDCTSCRIIGSGALGVTGVYALMSSRASVPGSPLIFGKRIMGGLGVGEWPSMTFVSICLFYQLCLLVVPRGGYGSVDFEDYVLPTEAISEASTRLSVRISLLWWTTRCLFTSGAISHVLFKAWGNPGWLDSSLQDIISGNLTLGYIFR